MAYRNQDKVPEKVQDAIFNELLNKPENKECADCGNKNPTWVSIDFGVFVCLRCSGLHRQLGPTITRVRSCKLDYSFKMEQIDYLINIGNKMANEFYERNLGNYRKLTLTSSMDDCWRYINDKYVNKKYSAQNEKTPTQKYLEAKANPQPTRVEKQEPVKKEVPKAKPAVIADLLSGDDAESFSDFKTADSFNSNSNAAPKNEINFVYADLLDLQFSGDNRSSSTPNNTNAEVKVASQPQQQTATQPELQKAKSETPKVDIFSLYSAPANTNANTNNNTNNAFNYSGQGQNGYSNSSNTYGGYNNGYPNAGYQANGYGNSNGYGMQNGYAQNMNGGYNNGYPQNNAYGQSNGMNYGNNAYNRMGYNANANYGNNPYFNQNMSAQPTPNYGMNAPSQLSGEKAKNVDITALYGKGGFF